MAGPLDRLESHLLSGAVMKTIIEMNMEDVEISVRIVLRGNNSYALIAPNGDCYSGTGWQTDPSLIVLAWLAQDHGKALVLDS
jgi:hypothetical protein